MLGGYSARLSEEATIRILSRQNEISKNLDFRFPLITPFDSYLPRTMYIFIYTLFS